MKESVGKKISGVNSLADDFQIIRRKIAPASSNQIQQIKRLGAPHLFIRPIEIAVLEFADFCSQSPQYPDQLAFENLRAEHEVTIERHCIVPSRGHFFEKHIQLVVVHVGDYVPSREHMRERAYSPGHDW